VSNRRGEGEIENVRVLRADTLFAVRYLLPESSVETFYLLFPDPWPKRRHQFRRIFTRDFLDAIAIALEKHGVLRVATDQLDYFHKIERLSRAHLQFQVVLRSPDDAVLPVTKFERKFREQGAPIYRLTLRKDFASQISSGAPFVVRGIQFYGTSFVLPKQFDAAGAKLLNPLFTNSFVLRKLA
jgi:tRNA G46 methylase TrmB